MGGSQLLFLIIIYYGTRISSCLSFIILIIWFLFNIYNLFYTIYYIVYTLYLLLIILYYYNIFIDYINTFILCMLYIYLIVWLLITHPLPL